MGYCIWQKDTNFVIKAENKVAALAAIKALAGGGTCPDVGNRHYSWVNCDEDFLKCNSLEDALAEWRWQAGVDNEGNIANINFTGEKYGDDKILFAAIAPYVEAESYVTMKGECNETFGWEFDGSNMKEFNE